MKQESIKQDVEPVRGSICILVIKLLAIVLFFDLIYLAIDYVFSLGLTLPFGLHHHVALALFIAEVIKIALQVYLIANISLSWANNTYHLAGKHIIKRTGIFHAEENVFPFENIRSVAVHQSFLGKLLNYGDIEIKISASGGYNRDVILSGIARPKKFEALLNTYF